MTAMTATTTNITFVASSLYRFRSSSSSSSSSSLSISTSSSPRHALIFPFDKVQLKFKLQSSFFPLFPKPIQNRHQQQQNVYHHVRNTPVLASASSPSASVGEGTLIEIQTSSSSSSSASPSSSSASSPLTLNAPSKNVAASTQQQQALSNRKIVQVVKPDGKRNWYVNDIDGQSATITPKQISFVIGNPSDIPEIKDLSIRQLYDAVNSKVAEYIDLLETTWELMSDDEEEEKNIQFLSNLIMDDTSCICCLATHVMLCREENIFFKSRLINGQLIYENRTQKNVNELKLLRQTKEKQHIEAIENRKILLDSYENRDLTLFQSILDKQGENNNIIEILKNIASEQNEYDNNNNNMTNSYMTSSNSVFSQLRSSRKLFIRDIFSTLSMPLSPYTAFEVLCNYGIFNRHENLTLRKYENIIPHLEQMKNKQIQNECRTIIQSIIQSDFKEYPQDIDKDHRIDLTHFITIAIDSADTSEVDDAFSYDVATDTIYVHIADPSRYFPNNLDDSIVSSALQKTSTLYLPYSKFTMFPKQIAYRLLSLDGDLSDGSALSFSFQLDKDTGEINESSINISLTRIGTKKLIRLTYSQVDDILKGNTTSSIEHNDEITDVLKILYERMNKRRHWREMEGGGIIINSPICNISIDDEKLDNPKITLTKISTDSLSWIIVSELMITACMIGGMIAKVNDLHMPFRSQEPFDYPSDEELQCVEDGPVRATLAFKQASPTLISLEPDEHASLGLDYYVQVTSPIRRSLDYVAHLQLKSWIRSNHNIEDNHSLSREAVVEEIGRFQNIGKTLKTIEIKTNRYWQLQYLQNKKNSFNTINTTDNTTKTNVNNKFIINGTYLKPVNTKDFNNSNNNSSNNNDTRLGLVFLDEHAFTIPVQVWNGIKLGEKVDIEIRSIDARKNHILAIGGKVHKNNKSETESEWDEALDEIMSQVSE